MDFAKRVKTFLQKSFNGKPEDEEDEGKKKADDIELEDDEGGEDEEAAMEKSELQDATEILNALVDELKTVNKSLAALTSRQDGIEKAQADVGEAVVNVAELVTKIANSPVAPKSAIAKGGFGDETAGSGRSTGRLNKSEFEQAQRALTKAFGAKEITIFEATRLESEMQKAMQIEGYKMRPEDRDFIARTIKSA